MGLFTRTPVVESEQVIDRIGLAMADSANFEIWYATFVGDRTVHRIHASSIEDKSHAVLARSQDRIVVRMKGSRVVGFHNVSLAGPARADAS
jgi:hypothetical protein